jgi:hypothetical protein
MVKFSVAYWLPDVTGTLQYSLAQWLPEVLIYGTVQCRLVAT